MIKKISFDLQHAFFPEHLNNLVKGRLEPFRTDGFLEDLDLGFAQDRYYRWLLRPLARKERPETRLHKLLRRNLGWIWKTILNVQRGCERVDRFYFESD